MESPREIHESRAFRWIGQPSEEALLGMPAMLPRRTNLSFQAQPLPAAPEHAAPVAPAEPDPLEVPPRWRLQGRDLIALAAVVAAVWFAVRGGDLPFNSPGPFDSPEARDAVATRVLLDRAELRSLPRVPAAHPSPGGGVAGKSDRGSSGHGSKDGPKKPPRTDEPSTPPLLQATIPGVGTVTVEQPKLPLDETPSTQLAELPSLPDADETLSGATSSLP